MVIVLGTIPGVACVTALFAWWVQIRSHAKRRHLYGDTDVPWASSENGDSGLEEARDMTQTRSNLEFIGPGGPEDLAQVEAWEPRACRSMKLPRHQLHERGRKVCRYKRLALARHLIEQTCSLLAGPT
ncbi:hypothetical protein F5887DRAFT_357663 [Amanita rubescens]|nr:hypothetical protein F5887DRAFT_357663 [Amanita rubescens]